MDCVRLPIEFDVALTTDCRLQERLSIIQTSPYSQAWLATHLDVFMDDNLSIGFGTGECVAHLNYFDDILISREINIWDTHPKQIISVLLQCIENNSYIIMDLYFEKKHKNKLYIDKPYSVLVYGFNKEKSVFYITKVKCNKYVESEITFSELEELYSDARDVYKDDATSKVLRQFFSFAITSITLRNDYSDDNCIFSAIVNKLGREEVGNSMVIQQYDAAVNEVNCFERFTGINCLLGVEKVLQKICSENLKEDSIIADLHKTIYQLYEHRKLILSSMNWINSNLYIKKEQIEILTEKYSHAVKNMSKLYVLSGKLMIKREDQILSRIRKKLIEQYAEEKSILIEYIGLTFKAYISQCSVENFLGVY